MKNTSKNERKSMTKSVVKAKAAPNPESETISELQNVPIPCHQLPTQMIVAIDGWAQSGKNTAGELVAEQIDGVLVDSGRFYRALTKAALDAGYSIREPELIARYCRGAHLEVKLGREGGKVWQALVSVNGQCYTKEELNGVGLETSHVARIREIRHLVNNALRLCQRYGRVVMLGRDIGGVVFPQTPYKFFLDASETIREQRHVKTTLHTGAAHRDRNDINQVVFAEGALLIDTEKNNPDDVRGIILVDLFWRTEEAKAWEMQNTKTQ